MRYKNRQSTIQGTAIFMALLIIAIVATIAVLLMRIQQINIRRTQMLVTSEQAYLYAQGVVDWAKVQLAQDLQNPLPNSAWPIIMRPTNIPGDQGKVAAILQDAEGLFNLNNFSDTQTTTTSSTQTTAAATAAASAQQANTNENAEATENSDQDTPTTTGTQTTSPHTTGSSASAGSAVHIEKNRAVLNNLLDALNVEVTAEQKQNVVNGLIAWTSAGDPSMSVLDTYDQQYSRLNPPYRSPHAPMVGVSELRTVQGMTPQLYNALLPFIVALPETTSINTNRAPPLILQAMGLNKDSQNASASATGQTSTSSKYFLLRADVYLQDQHLVLFTLLFRKVNEQNPRMPQISMLWQSFGTM